MSRFNNYFLMKPEDTIDYVKEKTNIFLEESDLESIEIGDGNLNYVFRIVDKNSDTSIILKQAGEVARISSDLTISTDRTKIESSILKIQASFTPDLVPKVHLYDNTMNCFLMEDLSDHTIMREALLEYKIFPDFAEDVTDFMVETLLPTTDLVMDPKDKKELLKEFINPDLCEITEELVYTEPYNDYNNQNILFPPNEAWIKENIYGDNKLKFEVAKLKVDFLTNSQALIHGDLHTGSVFIKKDSTKFLDPEFAFFGPIGYDVGVIMANLIFSYMNGETYSKEKFLEWNSETLVNTLNLFKEKFINKWEDIVKDEMAKEDGFDEWYLEEVLKDTAGIAGLELVRRIVGMAQVKDITSIDNKKDRVRAERICLLLAKELIKNQEKFTSGENYLEALKNTIENY